MAGRLVPSQRATRAATTVFAGVTVGFAFGVPLTSYLAEHLSLAAAFWFGAGVNLLAFLGTLALFPSMPAEEGLSYGSRLRIRRRRNRRPLTTARPPPARTSRPDR
ncbi:MFS transporter [Kitasatospora sp. NPDC059327]|uniref:MFS transporter n=1 Tax=Kitasatospora sp. NPDC059327 TaxID=3346803 RepID=UPI003698B521